MAAVSANGDCVTGVGDSAVTAQPLTWSQSIYNYFALWGQSILRGITGLFSGIMSSPGNNTSNNPALELHLGRKMTKDDLVESAKEREAKAARENDQLLLYIFVSVMISLAWLLGVAGCSFVWVFILIVVTFTVWWSKVMTMTEKHVRMKELVMHRKRALRQSETAEWLNFIINRWWIFSSNSISDLIKRNLDPLLNDIKPSFIESIELSTFTLGERTPFIKFVEVYECGDGVGGTKRVLNWASAVQPPPGLSQAQQYHLVVDADVGLQCDDFKMIFSTRCGGRWLGSNIDIALEKLNITGKMQFVINMDMDSPFPHISSFTVTFLEKPEVWFAVRMLKSVQMMEIPVLKSWIHNLVMDGLTQALVDPGKIDIKFESTGPTNAPAKARSKSNAQGILTVTIGCETSKSSGNKKKKKSSLTPEESEVFVEDLRYCVLRVGDQKSHTQHVQGSSAWRDTCSFLIDNMKTDRLSIKTKSRLLLSTYTLAAFDLPLCNFPFEQKQGIETILEEKATRGSGTVKLTLFLEYTPLPTIDEEIERSISQPKITVPEASGVMYICVHHSNNLLGLDRNGFSDPYCIIYSNGKKIKTTHYVCRTKNPKWEVSTEFIVADYSKTMLSFIVYDWDGHNASEDDFLGSAHILLTKDEPVVSRRSLTLGYNLLNVGQVDNNKLGTITVSVVFRSVSSVAKSEQSTGVAQGHQLLHTTESLGKKGFISSAPQPPSVSEDKQRLHSVRDRRSCDNMGVGGLLSLGHGILELNILQAKDLVAMDSNGFSDPYCDVRINNERKFTTSVKKKTLNPVWDEWVTTQLPKPGESMEIVVWDRDPLFRKDFLGSLTFTLDELKKLSTNPQTGGWHQLNRIRSGQLQLSFKVISQDMEEEHAPGSQESESADSGVHPTAHEPLMSSLSSAGDCDDMSDPALRLHIPNVSTKAVSADAAILEQGGAPPLTRVRSKHRRQTHQGVSSREPLLEPASSMETTPERRRAVSETTPRVERSASDGQVTSQSISRHNQQPPVTMSTLQPELPGLARSESHNSINNSLNSSLCNSEVPSVPSSTGADRLYCVHGRLMLIKGLHDGQQVYCKLRLDSRSSEQREQKTSKGRVIAKSSHVTCTGVASFNLKFEVDNTDTGLHRDVSLIFDIKTSHNTHLACRSYTLQELFNDEREITRWMPLDKNIQVQLYLSHLGCNPKTSDALLTPATRKRRGLFRTLTRSTSS